MQFKDVSDYFIYYPNEIEFKEIYDEVFKGHLYYVEFETLSPRIIDCGGHIGMSTLYFKKQYPLAKITVFEPEPNAFEYLEKNIDANKLTEVEAINKALWTTEGKLKLFVDKYPDNHWLSTTSIIEGAWTTRQQTEPIMVDCTRLSNYLKDEPIDLIKLDIEGAETEVIKEIQDKLWNVERLIIEFHANQHHRPEELVKILQNNGYTLNVTFEGKHISLDRMTRRKPTLYLIDAYRKGRG